MESQGITSHAEGNVILFSMAIHLIDEDIIQPWIGLTNRQANTAIPNYTASKTKN